jgi:putative endonuclease
VNPVQVQIVRAPMKQYYVYMMASRQNGTLYTGVTSNLIKRVHQHKTGSLGGFTAKYKVNSLVYFEITTDVHCALKREKNIQAWKRAWKIRLIEEKNPKWLDLFPEIAGCQPPLA